MSTSPPDLRHTSLDHESFAERCPLALLVCGSYLVPVHRFAVRSTLSRHTRSPWCSCASLRLPWPTYGRTFIPGSRPCRTLNGSDRGCARPWFCDPLDEVEADVATPTQPITPTSESAWPACAVPARPPSLLWSPKCRNGGDCRAGETLP